MSEEKGAAAGSQWVGVVLLLYLLDFSATCIRSTAVHQVGQRDDLVDVGGATLCIDTGVGGLVVVELDVVGLGGVGLWADLSNDQLTHLADGSVLAVVLEGGGKALLSDEQQRLVEVVVVDATSALWLSTREDQVNVRLQQRMEQYVNC